MTTIWCGLALVAAQASLSICLGSRPLFDLAAVEG